jgi:glucan 1,3-beta-glucosidase
MRTDDVRGVNLGGWLVLERWITPGLFDGVMGQDEFSLSTELGLEKARICLESHREKFITRSHIKRIKKLGLNSLRVPVGYWLFEDIDGFVGGSYRYLDKLFEWALEFDLQILICLHGAPGSQNGWDHSGRAGEIGWSVSHKANMTSSLSVIENIAKRYGKNDKLWGIEVVNEPHPSLPIGTLSKYYRKAGKLVRRYCNSEVRWVVSDAFRPNQVTWRLVFSWFRRPVLDQHLYQLFTPEDRALDFSGHISKAQSWASGLRRRRRLVGLIVGEWSAAMDELYLPDLKKLARPYTSRQYVEYAKTQQKVFELSRCGWFYWTARTEDGGVWSLLDHPEFLGK